MAEINVGVEKAIANLEKLLSKFGEFKTIGASIGDPSGKSLTELNNKLEQITQTQKKLSKASVQVGKAVEKEGSEIKKTSSKMSEAEKVTAALNRQKEKNKLLTTKEYKELVRLRQEHTKTTAAIRNSTKEKKKATSANKGLLSSTWSLIKAYGILQASMLFSKAIKSAFELTKQFDSLNFSMQKTVGTAEEVSAANANLVSWAKDYGAELLTLTNRYVKFFVAAKQSGVSLRDTNDIFETFTKVSGVMGLRADELNGVFLSLEQMLSKGKITTEELRRQLGERLPGAVGIMAASVRGANGELGVTIEQLDKMMKKGEIISSKVLPEYARQVEIAYGIDTVNKVDTLVAAQSRLNTSWQLFVKNIFTDSPKLKQVFNGLSTLVNYITFSLSEGAKKVPLIVEKMTDSVDKDFRKKALSAISETSKGFETSISAIDSGIKSVTKSIEDLNSSNIAGSNDEELKKLNKVLSNLISSKGKIEQEILDNEKTIAKERKTEIENNLFVTKKAFEENEAIFKEYRRLEEQGGLFFNPSEEISVKYIKALSDQEKITKDYAKALAEFNKVKSLLEEDSVSGETTTSKEASTNRAAIERLKSEIKLFEDIIKTDTAGFDAQEKLAKANAKKRVKIAELTLDDIKKDDTKSKDDLKLAQAKYNTAVLESETKLSSDRATIRGNVEEREIKAIKKANQKAKIEFDRAKTEEINRYEDLSKADQEKESEKIKHHNNLLKAEIEYNIKLIEIQELAAGGDEAKIAALELKIAGLRKALKELDGDVPSGSKLNEWLEKNTESLQLLGNTFNEISNLANAFTEQRLQNIALETEAMEEQHNKMLEQLSESTERSIEATSLSTLSAEEKAERAEGIRASAAAQEERLEKERLKREEGFQEEANKARKKQAIIDKVAALANIAINTSVAVTKVASQTGVFGIPLQAQIIALGALQAATVLATPIPQFAEGGVMGKDGAMLINDHNSGRQEYIKRGNEILTTNKRNAVVEGKKGDVIYKDGKALNDAMGYDMVAESIKAKLNGNAGLFSPSMVVKVEQPGLNGLDRTITKGIQKGFKTAQINNHISFSGGYAEYLKEKQQ